MKFVGQNIIALNEATVMAAVQMYMQSNMVEHADFKVTGVKQTDNREYCKTFEVAIAGADIK